MIRILIVLAALGFAGCSFAPVPRETATIGFHVTSSPSVRLYEPRFDMWDGHLDFRGIGYRTAGLEIPRPTHLDVEFRDAGERTLRSEMIRITFLSVRSRVGPDMGKYRLHVGTLPAGTVQIKITAHEAAHHPK
ncbi:MAG TPA: hypothetical protein VHD62_08540 [Opitutaceae bacterium]|nr:hypothetical protein [Opitutaceae bacterium]